MRVQNIHAVLKGRQQKFERSSHYYHVMVMALNGKHNIMDLISIAHSCHVLAIKYLAMVLYIDMSAT